MIKHGLQWLEKKLISGWQTPNILTYLLLPLSLITYFFVVIKRYLYAHKLKPTQSLKIPVIVVGNIYVGGTGKTPFIIDLIEFLKSQGFKPGVISRGYGVQVKHGPHLSTVSTDANYLGDEPALIVRRTLVPVAVHPQRSLAAQHLLAAHPQLDVIVSDDGLQHLALGRNIEIVIQDQRHTGNGFLLPAGPLREPASKLKQVDIIVTNIGAQDFQPRLTKHQDFCIEMQLNTTQAYKLDNTEQLPLDTFKGRTLAALCGLGHPQRFFDSLRTQGLNLAETIAIDDHGHISENVLHTISSEIILITEKDAVKCQHIDDPRIWVVPLTITLSDLTPYHWISEQLHGYKTT